MKFLKLCFLQGPAGIPGHPGATGHTGAPVRILFHILISGRIIFFVSNGNGNKDNQMCASLVLRSFLESSFIIMMLHSLQGLMGRPGPTGDPGRKGEKVR